MHHPLPQTEVHLDHHTHTITVTFPDGRQLEIIRHQLQITHFSHGHGGQNVNRHLSGVQLKYRIPDAFRRSDKKTQEIVVRYGRERHQEHNLMHALKQLQQALINYFYLQPPRLPTRTSKRIKAKRKWAKKHLSQKKQLRGNVKKYE